MYFFPTAVTACVRQVYPGRAGELAHKVSTWHGWSKGVVLTEKAAGDLVRASEKLLEHFVRLAHTVTPA